MDFLNDKKNQPIIAGVLIGVILLAGGIFYFTQLRPAAPVDTAASTGSPVVPSPDASGQIPGAPVAPAAPAPSAPSDRYTGSAPTGTTPGGQPAVPGQPAAGGQQGTVRVARGPGGPKPVLKARPDPFKVLNQRKPPPPIVIREAIPYPTFLIVPRKKSAVADNIVMAQADTTQRRMSGVIFNGTVTAILEIDGAYQVVKPGDVVENGAMIVDKIEPNKLVLRSVVAPGTKARYVEVKMAASSSPYVDTGSSGTPPPPPGSGRYDRNNARSSRMTPPGT